MTNDLLNQTKMEASGEGNFSVSMNTSSCTFPRGKAGPRPLTPGGVHLKIQTGMLVQVFGFEIWANPFFWGGGGREMSKTGDIFF